MLELLLMSCFSRVVTALCLLKTIAALVFSGPRAYPCTLWREISTDRFAWRVPPRVQSEERTRRGEKQQVADIICKYQYFLTSALGAFSRVPSYGPTPR